MSKEPDTQLACNVLLSSDIAVGHCIDVNQVEQPCGRLLAIITAIEGDLVRWKYLNSESDLTSYNRGAGCWSYRWEVTPIGDFGVEVRTEQSDGGLVYWCEPVADSKAKYKDGMSRPWQERGWRGRYVARPDVLRVATSG